MKLSNQINSKDLSIVHAVLTILLSIVIVLLCYNAILTIWDHFMAQAAFEINRWATQPYAFQ